MPTLTDAEFEVAIQVRHIQDAFQRIAFLVEGNTPRAKEALVWLRQEAERLRIDEHRQAGNFFDIHSLRSTVWEYVEENYTDSVDVRLTHKSGDLKALFSPKPVAKKTPVPAKRKPKKPKKAPA